MELLLKYEGQHALPAWEGLGGQRVGGRVWRFPGVAEQGLQALLEQIAAHTDMPVLDQTLAVPLPPEGRSGTAGALPELLDAALPFNALLAQLRYPWASPGLMERVEVHFQPIVDIASGGALFAHEALCRVLAPGGELLSGQQAFDLARRLGQQDALDLAMQRLALQRKAASIAPGTPLFLNVLPSTLLHAQWATQIVDWLREAGVDRRDVVIEVVESEGVDPSRLAERCDALRAQGLRIALDDMGAGFNSLSILAMVRADFIKLDSTLVHEAQGSRVRSVLLEALVSMADRLGATVIAEGLERPEDLAFCQGLGIRLAQGYLFARPQAAPLQQAIALPEIDEAWRVQRHERFRITDVLDPGVAFELHTPLSEVRAAFRAEPGLPWVVLTDAQRPVAMVHRGKALARPARSLAAVCQPLRRLLPQDISLASLARSLYIDRGDTNPWAVVDGQGHYMGTVEPMMLVSHMLARQAHGSSLHPLSQLPTGPSLRQAIEMRLSRQHGSLCLVYIDLDHFKAFNDRYGFIRGDAMIRTLSEILRQVFVGPSDRLLGHIGGDDFIVLLDREDPQLLLLLERAMAQFHALARHLYDAGDVERGYFVTDGGLCHPVASLSVAWVNGRTGRPSDSVAAAERAAQLKRAGKGAGGSVVVVEGQPLQVHRPNLVQPGHAGWQAEVQAMLQQLLRQPRSRDPHAFDHVFKAYPFFEMLFELDAQGVQRFPNWINPAMYGRIRAGGVGADRSAQPYFAQVAQSGGPSISPIYLSSASEDFCLTIAVPIFGASGEAGGLDGVLVGDLNLASMATLLDRGTGQGEVLF